MCNPGLVMVGAQSAGSAYSVVGSYYAAREQKAALRASAAMDELNARLSEKQAQRTLKAGQKAEQRSRLKNAAFESSQKVALAANGVDLGSDSAVALLASTDLLGEIDAKEIATDALYNAWGYRFEGVNQTNSALTKRNKASAINPSMSAFGTLLTEAPKVAGSFNTYNKYYRKPSMASTPTSGGGA